MDSANPEKKVIWHVREHRPVVTVRGKNEVGRTKVVVRHLSTACSIYIQFMFKESNEMSLFVTYKNTRGQRTHGEINLP